MTRSGSPAQVPAGVGQCEQVGAFSVFSSGAAPALGTLCGSACGSRGVPGSSNSPSFCHNPSEVASVPIPVTLVRSVHLQFAWPGNDIHSGSPAPCDRLVVHSARTLEWHSSPAHVVRLLGEFFFDDVL